MFTNPPQDVTEDLEEENFTFPDGYGHAYVEMASVEDAIRVRRYMNLLVYGDKPIEIGYLNHSKYLNNELQAWSKVEKRKEMSDAFEGLENIAIDFSDPRLEQDNQE